MTEKEISEYNKRCSRFLGYKILDNPKDAITTQDGSFLHEKMKDESPKFNSDWNWIMEIIKVIEKLKLGDVKIPITWSSMYQGVTHEVEEYYDATVVFNINGDNCTVDIIGTMRLRNDFIVVDNLPDKKEAVTEAINQFLIWYEK